MFNLYLTMNYKAISNNTCHLVEQMNTWSSTITIPQGDEYLDISSSAMGVDCSKGSLAGSLGQKVEDAI
jgi:hypothetical protein